MNQSMRASFKELIAKHEKQVADNKMAKIAKAWNRHYSQNDFNYASVYDHGGS